MQNNFLGRERVHPEMTDKRLGGVREVEGRGRGRVRVRRGGRAGVV